MGQMKILVNKKYKCFIVIFKNIFYYFKYIISFKLPRLKNNLNK